jgi:hypothetical protein
LLLSTRQLIGVRAQSVRKPDPGKQLRGVLLDLVARPALDLRRRDHQVVLDEARSFAQRSA